MGQPLFYKRGCFPHTPFPLKTSDAVKSSLKGVRGEAFFQESSPWKKWLKKIVTVLLELV